MRFRPSRNMEGNESKWLDMMNGLRFRKRSNTGLSVPQLSIQMCRCGAVLVPIRGIIILGRRRISVWCSSWICYKESDENSLSSFWVVCDCTLYNKESYEST